MTPSCHRRFLACHCARHKSPSISELPSKPSRFWSRKSTK